MTSAALGAIVIAPLVLAPLAWYSGTKLSSAPRLVALMGVIVQIAASGGLAVTHLSRAAVEGALLDQSTTWWLLVMDGLSRPFVVLSALIGGAAVSASWGVARRPGAHFGLLLVLQSAVAVVFLADSLLLFYVAWEAVLIPMFMLIGGWGSSNARAAATKFLVYTFAGGAVLLVGVIAAMISGGSTSISAIAQAGGVGSSSQVAVFWLLAVGMLVKLPVVPLHTWLPDAHTEAPTAGSIVLAGVLLKMGGYGLIRVAVPLAPGAMDDAGVVLVALGALGVIWGAATALVQTDLKRLVAYSSVAHMGFVAVAVGLNTPASLSAAVVSMVSHGFVAGLLFYLVGALYERAHTREMSRFGGLGSTARVWSVAFVFAALASAGLPGLSGFPGEFVTVLETYGAYRWWVLVLGIGVVLAAAYNLRAVRGTVQGPVGESSSVVDLDVRERATALVFGVLILGVGVAPWIITRSLEPVFTAVTRLGGGG